MDEQDTAPKTPKRKVEWDIDSSPSQGRVSDIFGRVSDYFKRSRRNADADVSGQVSSPLDLSAGKAHENSLNETYTDSSKGKNQMNKDIIQNKANESSQVENKTSPPKTSRVETLGLTPSTYQKFSIGVGDSTPHRSRLAYTRVRTPAGKRVGFSLNSESKYGTTGSQLLGGRKATPYAKSKDTHAKFGNQRDEEKGFNLNRDPKGGDISSRGRRDEGGQNLPLSMIPLKKQGPLSTRTFRLNSQLFTAPTRKRTFSSSLFKTKSSNKSEIDKAAKTREKRNARVAASILESQRQFIGFSSQNEPSMYGPAPTIKKRKVTSVLGQNQSGGNRLLQYPKTENRSQIVNSRRNGARSDGAFGAGDNIASIPTDYWNYSKHIGDKNAAQVMHQDEKDMENQKTDGESTKQSVSFKIPLDSENKNETKKVLFNKLPGTPIIKGDSRKILPYKSTPIPKSRSTQAWIGHESIDEISNIDINGKDGSVTFPSQVMFGCEINYKKELYPGDPGVPVTDIAEEIVDIFAMEIATKKSRINEENCFLEKGKFIHKVITGKSEPILKSEHLVTSNAKDKENLAPFNFMPTVSTPEKKGSASVLNKSLDKSLANRSKLPNQKGSNELVVQSPGQIEPKAPITSGWGDLFKPKEGEWKCETCACSNPKEATKCLACEAERPRSNAGNVDVSGEKKENDTKLLSVGEGMTQQKEVGKNLFSFGIPTSETKKEIIGKTSFSFGSTSSTNDENKKTETPKFKFGAPSQNKNKEHALGGFGTVFSAKVQENGKDESDNKSTDPINKPLSALSSFPSNSNEQKDKNISSITTIENSKDVAIDKNVEKNKADFKFGSVMPNVSTPKGKESDDSNSGSSNQGINFGFAATKSNSGFAFAYNKGDSSNTASSSTPLKIGKKEQSPKPPSVPFTGAGDSLQDGHMKKDQNGFEFKPSTDTESVLAEAKSTNTVIAPEKASLTSKFNFGSSAAFSTTSSISGDVVQESDTSNKKKRSLVDSVPKPTLENNGANANNTSSTSIGFGSSAPKTPASAAPTFSFGSSSKNEENTSVSLPLSGTSSFQFNAASNVYSKNASAPVSKSLDKPTFTFGSAPAAPAFSFGNPQNNVSADPAGATASKQNAVTSFSPHSGSTAFSAGAHVGKTSTPGGSGFSFNSSSNVPVPAPAPTSFNPSSTTPSSSSAVPSFSFGSSSQSSVNVPQNQGVGTPAPAFSFGSNATPSVVSHNMTTGASSFGFGSVNSTATPAPAVGFSSAATPTSAIGFGSAATPTPTTGFNSAATAAPSTGFGSVAITGPATGFTSATKPMFSIGASGEKMGGTGTKTRRKIRAKRPPGTR